MKQSTISGRSQAFTFFGPRAIWAGENSSNQSKHRVPPFHNMERKWIWVWICPNHNCLKLHGFGFAWGLSDNIWKWSIQYTYSYFQNCHTLEPTISQFSTISWCPTDWPHTMLPCRQVAAKSRFHCQSSLLGARVAIWDPSVSVPKFRCLTRGRNLDQKHHRLRFKFKLNEALVTSRACGMDGEDVSFQGLLGLSTRGHGEFPSDVK